MGNHNRQQFIDYLSVAYPVRSLLVYRGDVGRVLRVHGHAKTPTRGDRRAIMQLSKKSRQRLAFVALATPVVFWSMITLTYGREHPTDGKTVKDNLRRFLQLLTRDYSCSYLWVIEFQRRGAPHFHIMTTVPYVAHTDRVWVAMAWANALGYGNPPYSKFPLHREEFEELQKLFKVHSHEKSWELIREQNGGAHYLVKYATKTHQKTVPVAYRDVGRFWGNSADVTSLITPAREILLDETTLRDTLEAVGNGAWRCPIMPKYIWAVTNTDNT